MERQCSQVRITWMESKAVFADKTRALDVDMTPALAVTVSAALGEDGLVPNMIFPHIFR